MSTMSSEYSDEESEESEETPQSIDVNTCKEIIQDELINEGQREMFKRLLQSRLAQSGWSFNIRSQYIDYIREKGEENVNVANMISEMIPIGEDTCPEPIREEIEDLLWDFAAEHIYTDDEALSPMSRTPSPEGEAEGEGEVEGEVEAEVEAEAEAQVEAEAEVESEDNNITNGCSDTLCYQNEDETPDPGIGYNVPTPEMDIPISRTPSPVNVPRPLTPQSPIPILQPENIKEEHPGNEEQTEHKEQVSEFVDENDENDESVMENGRHVHDEEECEHGGEHRIHNEESEEELMDI